MSEIYLLSVWGKAEPERYEAYIQRSQGLDRRLAQAELLQTLIEAINDHDRDWDVSIRNNRIDVEWSVVIAKDNAKCSFEAIHKDLAIALLKVYTEALAQGGSGGGGS